MDSKNYPASFVSNMDETYLHACGGKPELVLCRGDDVKPVTVKPKESREHITLAVVRQGMSNYSSLVIQTISADGDLVTPCMAIFPLVNAPPITDPRTRSFYGIAGQSAGWITGTIFRDWASKVGRAALCANA